LDRFITERQFKEYFAAIPRAADEGIGHSAHVDQASVDTEVAGDAHEIWTKVYPRSDTIERARLLKYVYVEAGTLE
jgi:hypothetical protein